MLFKIKLNGFSLSSRKEKIPMSASREKVRPWSWTWLSYQISLVREGPFAKTARVLVCLGHRSASQMLICRVDCLE